MAERIEDYGVIGDLQSAALVGRGGSIDWLCFPRFDSPACFAALLGTEEHGRWLLAPARPGEIRRRYRDDSLVLETEHRTAEGAVRVLDFMPLRGRDPDVVRVVEGLSGRVPMRMELVIRFDYGAIVPWVRNVEGSLIAVAGPDALCLRTPMSTEGRDATTVAEFIVEAGERVPFVLTWFPSHHRTAPQAVDPVRALGETLAFWDRWCGTCSYDGPYYDAVIRSLVTLKALTFAPTGGIVAAATTSLPEQLGGIRNWDYRYCWLRDAAYTLDAVLEAGYVEEAREWRDWLLRAVAGDPADIQTLYGPAGERRLPELELPWLPGYEASQPVRIGNAACQQLQLDVYGELFEALHEAWLHGMEPDPHAGGLNFELIRYLETGWKQPDQGLWEVRGPARHFTHSKVMCWVAFDRAVQAAESFGFQRPPSARWRAIRHEIHADVLRNGFDAGRGTFVQSYGSEALDASLLLLPIVGFLPPDDPRVTRTVAAIERDLVRDGLVQRYLQESENVDGLPGDEGAFLLCSFWLVHCLALMGRVDEARELFERLLGLRTDLGLLAEEYDVEQGRLLGNFPQAFSHVGLVNAAFVLAQAERGELRPRGEQSQEQASPA